MVRELSDYCCHRDLGVACDVSWDMLGTARRCPEMGAIGS